MTLTTTTISNKEYVRSHEALKLRYPFMNNKMRRNLILMAKEKNVSIINPDIDNLLGAYLRHNETHYDSLLRQCKMEKEDARFIVKTKIGKMISWFKGERIA